MQNEFTPYKPPENPHGTELILVVPLLEKIWQEFSLSEMLASLKLRMPGHGEMRLPEHSNVVE